MYVLLYVQAYIIIKDIKIIIAFLFIAVSLFRNNYFFCIIFDQLIYF